MKFDFNLTLLCMVAVLLLGTFIINRVKVLKDYSIPEPVVGGAIAAVILLILHSYAGIAISFDTTMKTPLMLAFFSSIGLLADFASLKKGGKKLALFLVLVSGLLIMQNIVGIGAATMMGQTPLMGLLSGSITMSGGHGTGAAWASVFAKPPYDFEAATTIAMACATFGLISGGIIGGPVAKFLITHYKLKLPTSDENQEEKGILNFEAPTRHRWITPNSFIQSLGLIVICLIVGSLLGSYIKAKTGFNLPTFVYCLFVGVILRNSLSALKIHKVFDREVSILGNVSLSLFLALALMSVNLWDLVSLAVPMFVILLCQVVMMVLYAVFITFRFCGKDYDAAVLAAGHCGFGLGATPTAMVNMQTVTARYGMSHMAFIIVPLVGAFFIDLINALIINGFLALPIFT